MHVRPLMPRTLVVGVALAAAVFSAPSAVAVSGPVVPSTASATTRVTESLVPLVRLSAERGLLADRVAAAKWGTDQPIDDPARERQVLDDVARESARMGIDPAVSTRIFRDQIEASKIVQRGLHRHWTRHPEDQPTERPDLNEIRELINRINDLLLEQIRDTTSARAEHACGLRLVTSFHRIAYETHLDALHRAGLARALPSVCD